MNIFSNIGVTELIVILLLALIVVGPERLPEAAQKLAKVLRDIRRMYENLSREVGPELASLQRTTQELRQSVDAVRSIPKDAVQSVVEAAGMDDAVSELEMTVGTLQAAGSTVSELQEAIKHPLRGVADAARDTLRLPPPSPAEPGTAPEAATPPPALETGDDE